MKVILTSFSLVIKLKKSIHFLESSMHNMRWFSTLTLTLLLLFYVLNLKPITLMGKCGTEIRFLSMKVLNECQLRSALCIKIILSCIASFLLCVLNLF